MKINAINNTNFKGLFTNKSSQNGGNWKMEYSPYAWESRNWYNLSKMDIQRDIDIFGTVYDAYFNFDVHNITGSGLDETGCQKKFTQKKMEENLPKIFWEQNSIMSKMEKLEKLLQKFRL